MHRGLIASFASIVALSLSACGPAVDSASAACHEAFADAAAAGGMQESVEVLYRAVHACRTVDEWLAGSEANPGAISEGVDPLVFLRNVCNSLEQQEADLCQEAEAPSGT